MFFTVYEKLCRECGKTPSSVALALGINKSTVSQWKKEGTAPNSKNLNKIASYFGVTTDYLLGNEVNPKIRDISYAAYDAIKDESEEFQQDILDYINYKKFQQKKDE